jgi:Delta3-Delta2-enoyl-CoA isomerase
MSYMELSKDGDVHILTLTNGAEENRFTDAVVEEFHAILDKLESYDGNTALVITSSDPKYWSNGINLKWMETRPANYINEFGRVLDKLLLRFAVLNMPTVGCLNGHTYAAGAILATALDFRFMRADRGFFCFPAVDLRLTYTPIMHQIFDLLPDRLALTEMLLTGKRLGGIEAQEKKVVMAACPLDEMLPKSMEWARMLSAKDRRTYTVIKRNMRRSLVESWNKLPGH